MTATFAPGSLVTTAPRWQVQEQENAAVAAQARLIGLLSGLATLLLGGLGLFAYVRANRRELNLPERTLLPEPPADLSRKLYPRAFGNLFYSPQMNTDEIDLLNKNSKFP